MGIQRQDLWSLGHSKNSWLSKKISKCSGIWELGQKLWGSKHFPHWRVNFNTPLRTFQLLMKLLWLYVLSQFVQFVHRHIWFANKFVYIFCYIKCLTQFCRSVFCARVNKKEREITSFLCDNNKNYIKFCRLPTTSSKSVISITVKRKASYCYDIRWTSELTTGLYQNIGFHATELRLQPMSGSWTPNKQTFSELSPLSSSENEDGSHINGWFII
jgi:uncharacterized membrane protein SirB2